MNDRADPAVASYEEIVGSYAIVDTPREAKFDELVGLAASICDAPMSLINFVLHDRQWAKAAIGTDLTEVPAEDAFCPHALADGAELFEVRDATRDMRFAANPFVTPEDGVRYYAGMPFVSREGLPIGVLCVIDTKPRPAGLTEVQRQTLRTLANQVSAQLELRRAIAERDAHMAQQNSIADELRSIALHDPLTGLANRELLRQRLEAAISNEPERARTALMMLDVDHFKQINDTLGHQAGDSILKVIADRLRSVVRGSDTVARLGGDEFGILMGGIAAECDINAVTRAIFERLQQPIDYQGRQIDARLTIGAAIFPEHAVSAIDLMRYADVALYAAKEAGRGRAAIFEPAMLREAECHAAMITRAREALAREAITPWYQPQLDLSSGEVTGFEALMRVREADGRFEPPSHIAAAFEDTELATRLGHAMMRRVAADMRVWLDEGADFGRIAINASASEFRDGGYADRLLGALAEAGVPPHHLDLEVTETVFLDRDGQLVEHALRTLAAAGVRVALDDFGTGYASLAHLGRFPVDILKIDKSFVHGLGSGGGSTVIVNAILDIAANLGLEVVAEGIETHAEADHLRRCGCEIGQGFLLGMVGPAASVPDVLRQGAAARLGVLFGEPLALAA